jgi:hypothetical protein
MLLIGFAGIGFAAYRKVGPLAAGEELRPLFRPRISATTNQRTPPRVTAASSADAIGPTSTN